jgi:hypothetical protein
MEAYFDFDTQEGDDPVSFDRQKGLHLAYRTMPSGNQISCGTAFDFGLSAPGRIITMRDS